MMMYRLMAMLLASGTLAIAAEPQKSLKVERSGDSITIKAGDQLVAQYQLERPADSKLSVESGCYFHPVATPSGIVLTEVAPTDHLHHRGIFLAFVEMHGKRDADFWGWGEHAPKKDRKIVNKSVALSENGFVADNEWQAEGEPILFERLLCSAQVTPAANVLDFTYTLRADAETTLSQWAFSGFCARLRKSVGLEVTRPGGAATNANPSHLRPQSDWPDTMWYDYTLRLEDGKVAGLTVVNHPENPKTLWHNHRDLRMLNPCIVAPGPVTIKPKQPLVLRYRVIAHDGPANPAAIERLAKW